MPEREESNTEMNKCMNNATVRIKGYKKFMKRAKKIRKEIEKLNKSLKKTVELKSLL